MITKAQITKIHVLLNQENFMHMKREIVLYNSKGRTSSTRELTKKEGSEIIKRLLQIDELREIRREIIRLAWDVDMIWGIDGTNEDKKENGKINGAKIDLFLKTRGTVKKPLYDLTYYEAKKVHRQFLAIKKSHEKTQFNKELKSVLTEIGIGI